MDQKHVFTALKAVALSINDQAWSVGHSQINFDGEGIWGFNGRLAVQVRGVWKTDCVFAANAKSVMQMMGISDTLDSMSLVAAKKSEDATRVLQLKFQHSTCRVPTIEVDNSELLGIFNEEKTEHASVITKVDEAFWFALKVVLTVANDRQPLPRLRGVIVALQETSVDMYAVDFDRQTIVFCSAPLSVPSTTRHTKSSKKTATKIFQLSAESCKALSDLRGLASALADAPENESASIEFQERQLVANFNEKIIIHSSFETEVTTLANVHRELSSAIHDVASDQRVYQFERDALMTACSNVLCLMSNDVVFRLRVGEDWVLSASSEASSGGSEIEQNLLPTEVPEGDVVPRTWGLNRVCLTSLVKALSAMPKENTVQIALPSEADLVEQQATTSRPVGKFCVAYGTIKCTLAGILITSNE